MNTSFPSISSLNLSSSSGSQKLSGSWAGSGSVSGRSELTRSGYTDLHFCVVGADNAMDATMAIETATVADVNEQDHNGNNPLLWACSEGREDLVQLLVDQGTDVNAQNFAGETALFLAAARGQAMICQYLIEHGSLVNITSLEGVSPMHIAAAGGHREVLLILAARGAHINCQDEEGDTPLHYAVRESKERAVEFLVRDLKCDLDVRNDDSETPLALATELGENTIIRILASAGATGEGGMMKSPTMGAIHGQLVGIRV